MSDRFDTHGFNLQVDFMTNVSHSSTFTPLIKSHNGNKASPKNKQKNLLFAHYLI